jgi:tight adherence protein B
LTAGTTLDASNFTVTEQGVKVDNLSAKTLSSSTIPVAVVLAMDVSGSMAGQKLAAAKLAAKQFVATLGSNIRVALVAFGTDVRLVTDFTTDHIALNNGIDSLAIAGTTATFDAVVQSTGFLSRQQGIQHNLVLFTDGAEGDNSSKATLAQATSALQTSSSPITTVLLGQPKTVGANILSQLVGAVKGGDSLQAADTSKLQALFARAAQALSSQYILTYPGKDKNTKELNIGVSATVAGFSASDSSVVINKRQEAQPATGPKPASKPLVSAFGGNLGLYLGIGAAFLGLVLFLGMIFWAPAGRSQERALARRLRLYTRGGERKEKAPAAGGVMSASAVGRRAVALVDRLPKPQKFDEKLQVELDQAGWLVRSSEFVLIQVGGFVGGYLIGGVLLRRVWMGLAFAVLGAVAPRLALTVSISRRESAFLTQLPDTLQLLAGSLSAGYGFLQALDTVAKEAVAPTSVEFGRVLSEARLGRPIDEALESMAERVGGEDFKWVVLAINIQRQVGGNLSALLTTIANTLREREQVRRQIKVLSAEGRLSAVILVALPFVLFGYLSLINPTYIHQLTQETIGKIMMVGALLLIGVGGLWMRKMIKIDV